MKDTAGMDAVDFSPVPLEIMVLQCRWRTLDGWSNQDLRATFWRLYWCAHPGIEIVSGERVVRAAGRDLAIIPPGNDYNVRVQTAVSHLYIHFVGRVPGLRETAPVTTIRLPDYGAKLVAQIVDLRRSSPNDRLGAHLMSHSLVSLALSVCPGELFLSNTLDPSIDRAIAFMDEHLREPIVNASIASAVNLSTSTFIRRFRAQTGYSPHAYLMRLRAARAAALLMDRRVGLDEVAESVGLADRAHLFRVFAREYGIGPTGFRRLQRQYPPDGDAGDGRISDI